MKAVFTDPPRSLYPIPGKTLRYVRPPTSSLDWAGADWKSPTSLDFQTETMTARKWGCSSVYRHERSPVHPTDVVADLAGMWARMRRELHDARLVVDRYVQLGVVGEPDFMRDQWALTVRVKCWPAVPGVTVPTPDVTW